MVSRGAQLSRVLATAKLFAFTYGVCVGGRVWRLVALAVCGQRATHRLGRGQPLPGAASAAGRRAVCVISHHHPAARPGGRLSEEDTGGFTALCVGATTVSSAINSAALSKILRCSSSSKHCCVLWWPGHIEVPAAHDRLVLPEPAVRTRPLLLCQHGADNCSANLAPQVGRCAIGWPSALYDANANCTTVHHVVVQQCCSGKPAEQRSHACRRQLEGVRPGPNWGRAGPAHWGGGRATSPTGAALLGVQQQRGAAVHSYSSRAAGSRPARRRCLAQLLCLAS